MQERAFKPGSRCAGHKRLFPAGRDMRRPRRARCALQRAIGRRRRGSRPVWLLNAVQAIGSGMKRQTHMPAALGIALLGPQGCSSSSAFPCRRSGSEKRFQDATQTPAAWGSAFPAAACQSREFSERCRMPVLKRQWAALRCAALQQMRAHAPPDMRPWRTGRSPRKQRRAKEWRKCCFFVWSRAGAPPVQPPVRPAFPSPAGRWACPQR